MTAPSSYLICATPRSGSTLLCDLLAGTGVTGNPNSYYRRQNIPGWAVEWGVPAVDLAGEAAFDRAYLAAARRVGSGATGMFGLRVMWGTLGEMLSRFDGILPGPPGDAALLERAFGPVRYIHLSREDKVAQAVSLLRAEQSGLWHRAADGSERERVAPPAEPVYDAVRLSALVAELEADDACWSSWFARNDVTPLRLSYGRLAADPRATLAEVLVILGRDPSLACTAEVRTARLADRSSAEWVRRFRAE